MPANSFAPIRPPFVCDGSSDRYGPNVTAHGVNQTSPPTVGANNAGEFIRRYSPGIKKNVGITPFSPDVVEYTQV